MPALLLAAALWPARPGAGQRPGELDALRGEYVFAGGRAEERRLDAAIESVVQRMSFFVRAIARDRIRQHVHPEDRIRIDVEGDDRVHVAFDDWGPSLVWLDGRARHVSGPDGNPTALSGRFANGLLYVLQVDSRGERHNWLTLAPDGSHLTLQVRIAADPLPADIVYALTYRRR